MKADDIDMEELVEVFDIEIVDHETSHNLGGQHEDDDWSRDSYSTDHNIVGFKCAAESENRYYDLTVPYYPEDDTTYYVLYAVYTTGDSFGQDPGRGVEFIGFYKSDQLDIANDNMSKIESDDFSGKSESFSIKLRTPDGQNTFTQSCGWKGYFESLDYVDIASVRKMHR